VDSDSDSDIYLDDDNDGDKNDDENDSHSDNDDFDKIPKSDESSIELGEGEDTSSLCFDTDGGEDGKLENLPNSTGSHDKHLYFEKAHISSISKNAMCFVDDDSGTRTTCRSTDNENQSSQFSMPENEQMHVSANVQYVDPESYPVPHSQNVRPMETCSNPACLLLRSTVRQQEEQIHFLRRKLQEYADICEMHNIGQYILGHVGEGEGSEAIDSGTTRTTYKEKTYTELMGPWDIPFHVAIVAPKGSFGECSGITFAQHPSKLDTEVHRIRPSPTDDDDALPVVRTQYTNIHRKQLSSAKSGGPTTNEQSVQRVSSSADNFLRNEFSSILKAIEGSPEDNRRPGIEGRRRQEGKSKLSVKAMPVVLKRKYGRQKALYSGTLDPTSGCPHGSGSLRFLLSGDVYIGQVAFGEMHGFGTYYHRKSHRLFKGHYSRNSFMGVDNSYPSIQPAI